MDKIALDKIWVGQNHNWTKYNFGQNMFGQTVFGQNHMGQNVFGQNVIHSLHTYAITRNHATAWKLENDLWHMENYPM